jgi:hypothetical protein
MAEDLHAPLGGSTLDLEELIQLEACQARMGHVEGDGASWNSVWREPVIGKPEVGSKAEAALSQLFVELLDPLLYVAPLDLDAEITDPHLKEFLIRPICP